MKRIGIAVLSAASLLAAGTAAAAEPQWNYGQIGWIQVDGYENADYSLPEGDGFKVNGSIGFLENYHFQLSYEDGTYDIEDGDVDWDGYRATLGFHQGISASGNTQLIANINYFDIDFDEDGAEGGDDSSDGYGLGFGLRSMVSDKVELEGMINWTKGTWDPASGPDEDYTDTTISVGGRYHWLPNVSTGVTLSLNGDGDTGSFDSSDKFLLDLRYSFGSDISK
jgi:opacity protein-like surface antigen